MSSPEQYLRDLKAVGFDLVLHGFSAKRECVDCGDLSPMKLLVYYSTSQEIWRAVCLCPTCNTYTPIFITYPHKTPPHPGINPYVSNKDKRRI